jgi:hypothetical protein
MSWRIHRQLRRAFPSPLIDDFDDDFNINDFDIDLVPPSPPSASLTTTATVGRYNSRDLILSFVLSNILICHTSMLYMSDLVHLFYMIYILCLIWKLPNYLTDSWLALVAVVGLWCMNKLMLPFTYVYARVLYMHNNISLFFSIYNNISLVFVAGCGIDQPRLTACAPQLGARIQDFNLLSNNVPHKRFHI